MYCVRGQIDPDDLEVYVSKSMRNTVEGGPRTDDSKRHPQCAAGTLNTVAGTDVRGSSGLRYLIEIQPSVAEIQIGALLRQ